MAQSLTMTTRLSRWIEPRVAEHGGRSGFRLLHTGLDAFVARAVLIEMAERSLDLQYYIFHADDTGTFIIDRLIAAADRGVRVRLLLDDWGTLEKEDHAVAGLDAHPNIEVRFFNPYEHRSGWRRWVELLTHFARVNRRMHNKQLIADGQAVVLGGRNIGDEYFAHGDLDFQDVDVLAGGPVVRESCASFEAYWNSRFAVPISALGKYDVNPEAFERGRAELRRRVLDLRDAPYGRALDQSDLAKDLRGHALNMHWAEATVLSDPPEKLDTPAGTQSPTYLSARIAPRAEAVKTDLLVVSPYFVPGKRGVALLGGKSRSGTAVRVLTNSLAATDVWLVHAGYMKYRRPLLETGVRLYELKPAPTPTNTKRGRAGSSRASLHGKTFVFDRAAVFIGSMNLDPRSLEQNTEDGVLVHSPDLAAEVARVFDQWAGADRSYQVLLASRHSPEWVATENGKAVRRTREPEAGFWRRLGARVFSRLPIDWLI